MDKKGRQSGFSLLEMVVVVATILILAGALVGVGKYVKIRAQADLTKTELEVLVTALQQYYTDFGKFPFDTPDTNGNGVLGDDYGIADLQTDLTGTVSGGLQNVDASSAALFYFLDHSPNSRKIAEAVSASLVSNKDAAGKAIKLEQPPSSGTLIDLPRYIDPWGTSIRYEYIAGTAFPKLTSAGPDKKFATPDDIVK